MNTNLQAAVRNFLPNFPEAETFAVTLTMKQYTKGQRLDEIRASKNLRCFLNRLNRACLGNSARRYDRRIQVVSALETSYGGRLHYHLTIRNPRPNRPLFFTMKIRECWYETLFADKEIDIQPTFNVADWNRYITKIDHPNIDWENCHIA